jgi:hypothetical protein
VPDDVGVIVGVGVGVEVNELIDATTSTIEQ